MLFLDTSKPSPSEAACTGRLGERGMRMMELGDNGEGAAWGQQLLRGRVGAPDRATQVRGGRTLALDQVRVHAGGENHLHFLCVHTVHYGDCSILRVLFIPRHYLKLEEYVESQKASRGSAQ